MTVVVAHMSSPEGREALACAVVEARRRDCELVVVASAPDQGPAVEAEVRELGEGRLGEIRLSVEPGTGKVADDLVAAADRHEADVVVIGLRRRSPVGKLILGANAQRILLEAPCPVLAVKPDQTGLL